MSRLMSVSHTTQAVIERRKTVTRQLGWTFLKPGDRLTLCRKVMGRKKCEPLERLAEVEVVDVRREPLSRITPADIVAEGVPAAYFDEVVMGPDGWQPEPYEWARWFADQMGLDPREHMQPPITRIEWRYL